MPLESQRWLDADKINLGLIFHHAGIGIGRVSAEGKFIQVNPMLCEMVGYSAEELLKRTFMDLTYPEDLPLGVAKARELVAGEGSFFRSEKRYIHKNGQLVWVKIIATPVRDEENNFKYFVTAFEDITERALSDQLIRHQTKILELMAKNHPLEDSYLSVIQMIEDQAGALSAVNVVDQGKLFVGAAPSFPKEFLAAVNGTSIGPTGGTCGAAAQRGERVVSLDIPNDPCWGEMRAGVLALGIRSVCSYPVFDGAGKVVATISMCWKQATPPTAKHLEMGEIATRLLGIAIERDRTERLLKQQQMKMIASSKLAALGEMAGGLAHEINNPLAIISGWAAQLELAGAKGLVGPELVHEVSRSIQQTTLRISKIIKGLKAFARDGDQEAFQNVPAGKILEETLSFCRERFKSEGIELRLTFDELTPIRCRPVQLSQVLLNLLNNGYDAVENEKEKWIAIEVQNYREAVVITVTDSGPGILPEIRDKIAQPFFTTKDPNQGTGLGLSISTAIVAKHRGTLALDPNARHTSFVITLPKD